MNVQFQLVLAICFHTVWSGSPSTRLKAFERLSYNTLMSDCLGKEYVHVFNKILAIAIHDCLANVTFRDEITFGDADHDENLLNDVFSDLEDVSLSTIIDGSIDEGRKAHDDDNDDSDSDYDDDYDDDSDDRSDKNGYRRGHRRKNRRRNRDSSEEDDSDDSDEDEDEDDDFFFSRDRDRKSEEDNYRSKFHDYGYDSDEDDEAYSDGNFFSIDSGTFDSYRKKRDVFRPDLTSISDLLRREIALEEKFLNLACVQRRRFEILSSDKVRRILGKTFYLDDDTADDYMDALSECSDIAECLEETYTSSSAFPPRVRRMIELGKCEQKQLRFACLKSDLRNILPESSVDNGTLTEIFDDLIDKLIEIVSLNGEIHVQGQGFSIL